MISVLKGRGYQNILDMSVHEAGQRYFEGTGACVGPAMLHAPQIIFSQDMHLSPRHTPSLFGGGFAGLLWEWAHHQGLEDRIRIAAVAWMGHWAQWVRLLAAGVLVIDRVNGVAYVDISERADEQVPMPHFAGLLPLDQPVHAHAWRRAVCHAHRWRVSGLISWVTRSW